MVRNLRAELRARKATCPHFWKESVRSRYDKCAECGEFFPCKRECTHLDCGEARVERGMDIDYPDLVYDTLSIRYEDELGRCLFDNTGICFDCDELVEGCTCE